VDRKGVVTLVNLHCYIATEGSLDNEMRRGSVCRFRRFSRLWND